MSIPAGTAPAGVRSPLSPPVTAAAGRVRRHWSPVPAARREAIADPCADRAGETRDPRQEMAERLPSVLQPLLTWLTAMPAPGQREVSTSPRFILLDALARIAAGTAVSALAVQGDFALAGLLAVAFGTILTTSGMGIFQVVLFHYCAHGLFFSGSRANTLVGRAISIVFLFEYFDRYRDKHLQHHRASRILTKNDEFVEFMTDICGLRIGASRRSLRLRVLSCMISPVFHAGFLAKRIIGSLKHGNGPYILCHIAYWLGLSAAAIRLGIATELLVAWILPLVAPLQAATVLRILCEHRLPERDVLAKRGKHILCHATTGVFPGRAPPVRPAASVVGAAGWILWWIDLFTVQLFTRVFVLVGDAPCHDFHHRRYGTKSWCAAIYARQKDKSEGCPGFPANYVDVWGVFAAIDHNLEALSRAGDGGALAEALSRPAPGTPPRDPRPAA